jgi:hypothetical protein
VTVPVLHRVKNIFVITELIVATLFDRVLKVRQSKLLRVSVLVRYYSGGSMKLNACILFLAHMVYL